MSLYVTKVHPNPVGKDKPRYQPPSNDKLNEEWVEFANNGRDALALGNIALYHRTFDRRCNKTGYDRLTTFNGDLQPGHSIRVHTGTGTPWSEGTRWHLYAGRENFAWNNSCGDHSHNGVTLDWAEYDPNPPEGRILQRITGTNKLR